MEIVPLLADMAAPEPVEVVVEEDDRHLLLREQPLLFDVPDGFTTLTREMQAQRPRELGDVVVCRGDPLRLIAIVYDVDREPIWDEVGVVTAYQRVINELNRWQAATVMMPLLGTAHGHMSPNHSADLLGTALNNETPALLEQLYLRLASDCDIDALRGLLE